MSAEAGTGSMPAWCVEQGGVEAGRRHCLGVERLREEVWGGNWVRGGWEGPGQERVGGGEVRTEG